MWYGWGGLAIDAGKTGPNRRIDHLCTLGGVVRIVFLFSWKNLTCFATHLIKNGCLLSLCHAVLSVSRCSLSRCLHFSQILNPKLAILWQIRLWTCGISILISISKSIYCEASTVGFHLDFSLFLSASTRKFGIILPVLWALISLSRLQLFCYGIRFASSTSKFL